MVDENVKKLQGVLLSILVDVKNFCDKYNLKYCLIYGSAIGAERHHGFIPWDDDLDIAMPLDDVDKFVELWDKYSDKTKYRLQKIDENSHINHLKVILVDSPFVVESDTADSMGLFLDIFPIYKVKKNKVKNIKIWNIVRLVYTRDYIAKNDGTVKKIASWCMINLVPKCIKVKLLKSANKHVEKYRDEDIENCYMISLASYGDMQILYDYDIFDELHEVDFDGVPVKISGHNKDMLTLEYGNYMELPPIEKRVCGHNFTIVNKEENSEI